MYASKRCGAACVIRDATNEEGSMTEMRGKEGEREREREEEREGKKKGERSSSAQGVIRFIFMGDQRFVAC